MKLLYAAALVLLLLSFLYFGLTRYLFGSSHPCAILVARMTPYRAQSEREKALDLEREHSKVGEQTQFQDSEVRKLIEQDWRRIEQASQIAKRDLEREISGLTLPQCAYRALTWNPPEEKSARR